MTSSSALMVREIGSEVKRSDGLSEEEVLELRNARHLPSLRKNRMIDLFSGAGGLSLGFSELFGHSFRPVFANDFDEASAATYNRNFGAQCHVGDIVDLLESPDFGVPDADVVVGGPPCQGFSLLNKKRRNDPRKALWRPFLETVERSGAEVFVMENVPQLLGSPEFELILEQARRMDFQVSWAKLLAADFGVPQTRTRAFIVGSRSSDPSRQFPPKKTHFRPDEPPQVTLFRSEFVTDPQPWRTVADAIRDLEPPVGTEIRRVDSPYDLHFGRNPTKLSRKRYRAIPEEGMNRFDLQENAPALTPECWKRKKSGGTDLFGRLWWDRPSFTIRTEFFKPEKGRYLHPEQHRPITHREAARFQSFPDFFRFEGSKIEIARQIGNAVPPALAARLADSVYAILVDADR